MYKAMVRNTQGLQSKFAAGMLYTNDLMRSVKPTHLTHHAKAGFVLAFSLVSAEQ
jgi:hypothetical protein